MTRFLLLLVAGTTASAQLISFGAKIGAPLKDSNLNSNSSPFSTSNIGRWSGGPTIELHLPYRLSIEVDALYHSRTQTDTFGTRLGDPASDGGTPFLFASRTRTKAWEFPILIKYRFLNGPIRPFVSAGASLTHEDNENSNSLSCLGSLAGCAAASPRFFFGQSKFSTFRKGPTAGAGIEFK